MEAILGFRKVIKHLDGHEVVIEREGITQPGYIEIMEGEGMPILGSEEKGKLYVTLKVNIPNFSEEELLELETFFNKKNKK
jgi:DnaJ-related protein SCJ1